MQFAARGIVSLIFLHPSAEFMFGKVPRNSIQTNLGLWWTHISLIFSSPFDSS